VSTDSIIAPTDGTETPLHPPCGAPAVSLGSHQKDSGEKGSGDHSSGLPYASINNPNDTPAKAAVNTLPVEMNVSTTLTVESVREDEDEDGEDEDGDDAVPENAEDKCPPRRCSGWYGNKYNQVFQQAVKLACPLGDITMQTTGVLEIPDDVPLPPVYNSIKRATELLFCKENDLDGYVLRSNKCDGIAPGTHSFLCGKCALLSRTTYDVLLKAKTMDKDCHENIHFTEDRMNVMSDSTTFKVFMRMRKDRDTNASNMKRRLIRRSLKKSSKKTKRADDREALHEILELAAPFAAKDLGEDSMEYAVFQESIKMLGKRGSKGARYNDTVIEYALVLLKKSKKEAYDSIAKILHLPSRRHLGRIQDRLVGKSGDGPQRVVIREYRDLMEDRVTSAGIPWSKVPGAMDVVLSFDSMYIRGKMLLSSSKSSRNKIIGVVVHDQPNVVRDEFTNYVAKMISLGEKGNDESLVSNIAHHLELNKEHHVFYAKSMAPGVDLTFIAGAFNVPNMTAYEVMVQADLVMRELFRYGFTACFTACLL
jgi:hypothetical protein